MKTIHTYRACADCRHYIRRQIGPHEWDHGCYIKQFEFPNAEYFNLYDPQPPHWKPPEQGIGLGYVWDNEFEGRP